MSKQNSFNLLNSLAVVTGGAGLLGIKHCEALLEANSKVVILDKNEKSLDKCCNHLSKSFSDNFLTLLVDITKEDDLLKAKKIIQKEYQCNPDILINNAAIDAKYENNDIVNKSRLEDFDINQWNQEISVGLTGAFLCTKHFGIEMKKQKKGVILNISSDLGIIGPNQGLYEDSSKSKNEQTVKPITYSVIKHGIIGMTRYIATYWAKDGVRCNALAPGAVYNDHDEEFARRISALIPMGRMANINEYKDTVVYMCSDASSYMNGAVINLDGGRTAW